MILGEYVGPEYYASEAVMRSKVSRMSAAMTRSIYDLLSSHHASDFQLQDDNSDALKDISVTDVQQQL